MEDVTFQSLLDTLQIDLGDRQFEQFNQYYKILVEWNEFMNLTAITEYQEVLVKHFIDSLIVKPVLEKMEKLDQNHNKDNHKVENIDFNQPIRIIDVGTGAGFPGLPLKIAFPNVKVTLLDSLNKRVKFLNEVITQLSLHDIEAIHGRAEDVARLNDYRESFDIAVSRAVANLATLVEYCLPFVKNGGYFIAYKSGEIEEETKNAEKAIRILGGEIVAIYPFQLPETQIDRSFVLIRKVKTTSKKYPRKSGLPGKEPLE